MVVTKIGCFFLMNVVSAECFWAGVYSNRRKMKKKKN